MNSQWTLKGQVRITLPDGKLASDTATVSFKDNQIVRAQIRGAPAVFEQRLEKSGQLAQGRARGPRPAEAVAALPGALASAAEAPLREEDWRAVRDAVKAALRALDTEGQCRWL